MIISGGGELKEQSVSTPATSTVLRYWLYPVLVPDTRTVFPSIQIIMHLPCFCTRRYVQVLYEYIPVQTMIISGGGEAEQRILLRYSITDGFLALPRMHTTR